MIVAGLGVIAGHVYVVRDRARRVIDREEAALAVLWQVRGALGRLHGQEGRYAFVEELEGAGLLAGLEVVQEEGRRHVASEGYRIDVLLPHARLGQGLIAISPRGAEHPPDPDLSTRHFAVVARPLEPLVSGTRMYYVDEKDDLFLNEGIVDDAGARFNPLPLVQIRESQRLDSANAVAWQRAWEVEYATD